jgi:hypothetical protein
MGLIVIGLLALAVIAVGFALMLRAVAGLRSHVTERCNSLADLQADLTKLLGRQTAKNAEENLVQSKITRSYLVEILERRLLPHVGWKEKPKTEVEQWMLEQWRREVTNIDCGEMDDAPQQTNQ